MKRPVSSVPPALPGERHRSLEEMIDDLARHDLTTATPTPKTSVLPNHGNRNASAESLGRRGVMGSNPDHLARTKPCGARVQGESQRFATVSEFRSWLTETCALDARRALDDLLKLGPRFRRADMLGPLEWSEGMVRHWPHKFIYWYGVLRRDGAAYRWAVPLASSQETGT